MVPVPLNDEDGDEAGAMFSINYYVCMCTHKSDTACIMLAHNRRARTRRMLAHKVTVRRMLKTQTPPPQHTHTSLGVVECTRGPDVH